MRGFRERHGAAVRSRYAGSIDTVGRLGKEATRILRARCFPVLALADEHGRPHATVVWADIDGDGRVVVNTAEGRVKARLMKMGTPVALCAPDPENPYRYVMIRGRVVERIHEGALETIDALCRKYHDGRSWTPREDEIRVTVLIQPEQVVEYG